jgi:diacylglycerol diphosphate phosphatase/phosphatidate phosphatase
MKHSQPYLKEYIDTTVSAIVSFAVPAAIMGAIALWGTRGFGDGNAAVCLAFLPSLPSSILVM